MKIATAVALTYPNTAQDARTLNNQLMMSDLKEISQSLVSHYYKNFCEDGRDGSRKDIAIIEKIKEIESLHKNG